MNSNMDNIVPLALARKKIRHTKGYVHKARDSCTRQAAELVIIKPLQKLLQEEAYPIGGTRTEARPDFWFHFTTSIYAHTYLLNLFVTVSWKGLYLMKYICNSKLHLRVDTSREIYAVTVGYGDLKERSFHTKQNNENVYVMTYQFDAKDIETCETLVIPFAIKYTTFMSLTNYYHRRNMLTKLQSSDFEIISSTGLRNRVHAGAIVHHSPVLGRLVSEALAMSKRHLVVDIIDPYMVALSEFIYLNDIYTTVDYLDVAKLVGKYELTKLYEWVVIRFKDYFSYANAYEITRLAAKYDWKEILQMMFEYIEYSPEILHTFGVSDEYDKKILTVLLKHLYCGENLVDFEPIFTRPILLSTVYLRNYD